MTQEHPSGLRVAWKSGSGKRWSVGLLDQSGEEFVLRAPNMEKAEAMTRAVLSDAKKRKALQMAHSALFPHGECETCSQALEVVEAALADGTY